MTLEEHEIGAGLRKSQGPEFGLQYVHFSDDEIIWISNDLNLGTDYHTEVLRYRRFRDAYPQLNELESLSEMRNVEFERLPKWMLSVARRFLLWLANYGRVSLSLNFLSTRLLRQVPKDETALVNKRSIDWFISECKRLGVAESVYDDREFVFYWRFLLWSGQPLEQAADKFEVFCKEYNIDKWRGGNVLRSVLLHNGFISKSVEHDLIGDRLLKTPLQDVRKAYRAYMEYYAPTIKSGTSNNKARYLRTFISWLDTSHPEVPSLSSLTRAHVREFILYVSDHYCVKNRNACIASVRDWINWLQFNDDLNQLAPKGSLFTNLDILRKPTHLPKNISTDEMRYLFRVIQGIDEQQHFLEKMVLLLLMDTGARIREILDLEYDCLFTTPAGTMLRFLKHKQNSQLIRPAGTLTVHCIKRLQRYAQPFTALLTTSQDPVPRRRLFVGRNRVNVMDRSCVDDVFKEVQARAGLIDSSKFSDVKYKPHDLRRIYVTALERLGTPEDILMMLTGHTNPGSLIPYEMEYERANEIFALIEQSGVLVGASKTGDAEVSGLARLEADIVSMLENRNIRERQRVNLQRVSADPLIAFPLIEGSCMGRAEIDCWNGPLTCPGCNHFVDIQPDSVDEYLKEVFLKQRELGKKGIELPMIDSRLHDVIRETYVRQRGMTYEEAERYLESLKASVLPKRGRPRKTQQ